MTRKEGQMIHLLVRFAHLSSLGILLVHPKTESMVKIILERWYCTLHHLIMYCKEKEHSKKLYLFLHKDMIHLVKEVSRGDEDDDGGGGALKETGRRKEGKKISPKGRQSRRN